MSPLNLFTHDQMDVIATIKDKCRNTIQKVRSLSLPIQNVIIAGGCMTSWAYGQEPRDIDVFILDTDVKIYVDLKSRSMYVPGFSLVYDDARKNTTQPYPPGFAKLIVNHQSKLQFICTSAKTRRELIDGFDYVHAQAHYEAATDQLWMSYNIYQAINAKRLIKTPAWKSNPARLTKLSNQGFV